MEQSSPELILESLIKIRKNFTTVDDYLSTLESLIFNQKEIIETCSIVSLPFEHIVDLLYDYSQLTPERDETLIFRAAIEWLTFEVQLREKFARDVLKLVKFESMNSFQLQACFNPVFKIRLATSLTKHLESIEDELVKKGKLDHRLVFVKVDAVRRYSS